MTAIWKRLRPVPFAVLGVLGLASHASAQAVGVDWTQPDAGTLDGISVSLSATNLTAFNANLSGADFAAAPLGTDAEVISYSGGNPVTVTFGEPVSDLLVYAILWRGPNALDTTMFYTFDQPFTVLSGLAGGTVSGGGTVLSFSDPAYYNGILQIEGPVTSLIHHQHPRRLSANLRPPGLALWRDTRPRYRRRRHCG